jgi:hypothetical protein
MRCGWGQPRSGNCRSSFSDVGHRRGGFTFSHISPLANPVSSDARSSGGLRLNPSEINERAARLRLQVLIGDQPVESKAWLVITMN